MSPRHRFTDRFSLPRKKRIPVIYYLRTQRSYQDVLPHYILDRQILETNFLVPPSRKSVASPSYGTPLWDGRGAARRSGLKD